MLKSRIILLIFFLILLTFTTKLCLADIPSTNITREEQTLPPQEADQQGHEAINEIQKNVGYVVGEIARPGKIEIEGDSITVKEVLERAGWPLESASTKKCRLVSTNTNKEFQQKFIDVDALLNHQDESQNLIMKPGDTLYIFPSRRIICNFSGVPPVAHRGELAKKFIKSDLNSTPPIRADKNYRDTDLNKNLFQGDRHEPNLFGE